MRSRAMVARYRAALVFLLRAGRVGFNTAGPTPRRIVYEYVFEKFDQHEIDDFYAALSLLAPVPRDHSLSLAGDVE